MPRNPLSAFRNWHRYWYRVLFIVCILAFIGISGFPVVGRFEARKQEWFYVIKQPTPEVAIIRAYGDYLYGIPFNRATKEFERHVVILKMPQTDNTRLTLTREQVGPLQQPKPEVKP